MDIYIGYTASLVAAFCWAICSICFTRVGKTIGALSVAFIRLWMALGFYMIYGILTRGLFWPTDASMHAWIFMSLSGLMGFFIGDIFLFRSFLMIGPRLSLLIISIWPAMATILAVFFLHENLTLMQVLGIIITLAGIIFVVSEKKKEVIGHAFHLTTKGIIFATIGAIGQASGLVLSKIGMQSKDLTGQIINYDPFAACQIRTIAAIVCFAILYFILKRWGKISEAFQHRKEMLILGLGSFTGPFIGVAASLIALQYISTGVSATIASTAPILIIPLVIFFNKEKVSLRACCGAIVAVAGVAILILYK